MSEQASSMESVDHRPELLSAGFTAPKPKSRIRFVVIPLLFAALASTSWARPYGVADQCEYFRTRDDSRVFEKSGTPRLFRMLHDRSARLAAFQADYNTLDRPEMSRFTDSAGGHFRMHFDTTGRNAPDPADLDGNTVPDYVDSALVFLEYAWSVASDLGYGTPRSDLGRGGSNAVDVYIQELSPQGYYGYTSPDNSLTSMGSSYMVLDNNYLESVYPTKGLDALKVTSIHEYFHVIHYTYYGGTDAVWWMEQTAVWMEDYAWDGVNDYLNYIGGFLSNRNTSLDSNDNSYMYGAALFAFMLSRRHTPQILRTVWNEFRDRQSGRIEYLNPLLPGTLTQALSDLAVWSYFTADRANPRDFFKDSALLKSKVTVEDTLYSIPATDSLSCRRFTFKYVEIAPTGGLSPADSLEFTFSDRNGGIWKKNLILFNTADDYEIREIPGTSYLLTLNRTFRSAVLVFSNTATGASNFRMVYSIRQGGVAEPVIPGFALDQNYPNPFNRETVIQYTVPEPSPVSIRIVNQAGQTVRVFSEGLKDRGIHRVTFDASGLSSGVYFALLESGSTRITRKMLFLK